MSLELENLCKLLLKLNIELSFKDLKLLLFYCQCWYYTLYNKFLFSEEFIYDSKQNMILLPELDEFSNTKRWIYINEVYVSDEVKFHVYDVYEILKDKISKLDRQSKIDLLFKQPTKENIKKVFINKVKINGYDWFCEKVPIK